VQVETPHGGQGESLLPPYTCGTVSLYLSLCVLTPVEARAESAWFQRLILTCEELASTIAFKIILRRYFEAWGADVSAAVDFSEAETYLDGDPPVDTTAILSLSLAKWDLTVVNPFMDFVAASLMKARFWVGRCR